MAPKIYRTSVFILLFLMLFFSQGFTQQTSPKKPETAEQQKDYQQQMKNLQQNMRDLQNQMSDLRQQHLNEILKQNAENLRGMHFMKLDSLHNFIRIDSIKAFSRALANNITASVNGLTKLDILRDGIAFNDFDAKQPGNLVEKTKTYSKSYPVNKNDKLTIDNQYGKVTVNTWNKNEFKVDVEIKVGAADEGEAQRMLDNINIISTQNQDGISFKTNIANQDNKSLFMISRNSNYRGKRETSVNYNVFMPVKNALDITNRFGAVDLPDLEGPVTIRNSYGGFTAKELSNTANDIRLKFGNANIEALNGGNLNFEYGNLKIGTANNLNATMGFSPVSIEKLKSSANIKVQYGGGLKINNLDKNLKNLDIDASFANVSLDLKGSENFLFDVTVKYNQFNYNNNLVKIVDQPETDGNRKLNFTKIYKGYVGKAGSNNKVTIKSNYQGVNFN